MMPGLIEIIIICVCVLGIIIFGHLFLTGIHKTLNPPKTPTLGSEICKNLKNDIEGISDSILDEVNNTFRGVSDIINEEFNNTLKQIIEDTQLDDTSKEKIKKYIHKSNQKPKD